MAKLSGRIPATQAKDAKPWNLANVTPEDPDRNKVFRLNRGLPPGRMSAEDILAARASSKNAGASSAVVAPGLPDLADPMDGPEVSTSSGDLANDPADPGANQVLDDHAPADVAPDPALSSTPAAATADRDFEAGFLKGETEGYLKGEAEGFAAGESAGREHGRQAAELAFQQEIQQQQALLQRFEAALANPPEKSSALQDSLVSLVSHIAEVVILSELKANPNLVVNLVKHALAALPDGTRQVQVKVNPVNLEFLKEHLPPQGGQLDYLPDPNLSIGSCIVTSEQSTVDGSLGKRIHDCLLQVYGGEADEIAPEVVEETLIEISQEMDTDGSSGEA